VSYYRIKVIDGDGFIKYSPTVSVQLTSNLNEGLFDDLVLAPNPTENELHISATSFSTISSLEIIYMMGRVVFRQNPILRAKQSLTISTSSLANGSYTLRLRSGSATMNRRFVKR